MSLVSQLVKRGQRWFYPLTGGIIETSETRVFPKGSYTLFEPKDAEVEYVRPYSIHDQVSPFQTTFPSHLRWLITHPPLLTYTCTCSIVFIHDLTEDRDEAWKLTSWSDPWPKQLLPGTVAKARIVAFGYDAGKMVGLRDMLDPENLKTCAKELLNDYPLRLSPASPSHTLQGDTQEKQPGSTHTPVDIERPAVFVAHGFGGLVYEQVGSARQRSALPTD